MTSTTNAASQSPAQEAGAGSRYWLMLVVLLIGQFMALMDVTITNVAVPTIGADLNASGASLQLVVAGYTVSYAMLLITGARLGDVFGRRRMYMAGMIGFTLASLVCGLAPNDVVLVVARFVQGAAAAVMVPQIISVIQMQFTGRARATALSGFAVVLSVGALVGLILGGFLVNADLLDSGWRPVFLVNLPIGILVTILVPRLVPADAPRGSRRLDFVGLAIAVPALFLIVLPLVLGREENWPPLAFAAIAVGVLLAVVFVFVERRIAARGGDPLLNLDVLRAPSMSAGLVTLMCSMVPYGGFLFIFTLHLQAGLGDSALRAGLTYVPMSASFGLIGFYWRKLPETLHHLLAPAGMVLCLIGYLGIAVSMRDGGQDSPLMWIALVALGVGLGAGLSPLVTQSLVHVPLDKAADASGLFTTTMQLGQVIGVAAFGSVFLALARHAEPNASAHALSDTSYWLVPLVVIGLVAGMVLARTVRRAQRLKAAAGG
jgi:EmrB/QacA subfamily drug resistance transporter